MLGPVVVDIEGTRLADADAGGSPIHGSAW